MPLFSITPQLKYIWLIIVLITPYKTYATTDKFDVSGFARLVGGYLDESSAEYQAYDNSLTFSPDSLLGIKGEYRHNEQLSFVAQGIFTNSSLRKSGFDWLYMSYKPSTDWQFDFGRYRTPFFEYSEVINVGFAYPWVIPPQTTYVNALFASIDGARATYLFNIDKFNFSLSAFGGQFNSNIFNVENSTTVESDLLTGINLRMNTDNFRARISYVTGDFEIEINDLSELQNILKSYNFNNTANEIEIKGGIDIYQFSAAYETLDYFALTEATLIKGDSKLVPNIESYNLTLGLFHNDFTYYTSASKLRTTNPEITNEVPIGVTPELTLLNNIVDKLIEGRLHEDVDIATVGIRWDIKSNLAFKAEVDMIKGKSGQRSTFSRIDETSFNNYSTLYLFSIDWLF
ncbi:hypothetical protein [Pseudocolwellia agarivorans]|uniref:hypothetical protein n=1 Tax=Pseudocolwellia agarivorans TaxID=1911682 RepID=UPI0009854A4C|nr:hypothetical protein [Pseudocolwellia agarivorans]